jgi:hypothetical protein
MDMTAKAIWEVNERMLKKVTDISVARGLLSGLIP